MTLLRMRIDAREERSSPAERFARTNFFPPTTCMHPRHATSSKVDCVRNTPMPPGVEGEKVGVAETPESFQSAWVKGTHDSPLKLGRGKMHNT